ncbi:YecA family protein [Paenibacillus lutimineralis]|uniref:Zinc chelation protein SecC n=1 Tax=Paenibacillus lutimineralis TaxID=2707005 RepID=A0A3S9UUE1_9BACL|nr:SEC-C metal-binding domain-containing protein [Paenibacillus lutimineralis]AZS13942.1 hypothetical protein EI981_05410 [Paenibacillus lutimineralis]
MLDNKAQFEATNIQHAIIGEVMTSLKEILHSLTKTRLAALASVYKVPGRSKLKKGELADKLLECITDREVLKTTLLLARAEEWKVLKAITEDSVLQDNYVPYGYYAYWLEHGLVVSYFTDNKLYLLIPDEVKAAYAELEASSFGKVLNKYQLVFRYISAATNLYGAIKPGKLVEIFNEQNDDKLTAEELKALYEEFSGRDQLFRMYKGYLIVEDLVYSDEASEFKQLLEKMKGKSYHVPEKDELLKYSNGLYYEMNPQLTALRSYIIKELRPDPEFVDDLIDDIQLACSMEAPIQEIMHEFERRDIEFVSMEQVQMVVYLVTEAYNHTRLASNGGYTPVERRAISKDLESGYRAAVPPFRAQVKNQVISKKIGRNDPCPCGSGLKYKKCCGK